MGTLNILAVADYRHKALYDYFDPARWREIDLVISSGDLDAEYLSFLVTVIHAPLLYVPGNHDQKYRKHPPEGCDTVDGRVVEVKGVVIAGLGGSHWYNGKDLQYTEKQMRRRVRKLRRKVGKKGRLDLLVTHAPPRGIHDQEDMCHTGFESFHDLVAAYPPQVFVHGHNHQIHRKEDRELTVEKVRFVNACGYHRFTVESSGQV
jgi:Icc-related predicted phosphoesterase